MLIIPKKCSLSFSIIISLSFIIILSFSFFFLYSSSSPRFLSFTSCLPQSQTQPSPLSPLRVFMYDLPARFHYAMFNPNQEPSLGLPPWPAQSGIKRQHSVEYWMMASLVGEMTEGKEVVRVMDGEKAEVFFVPFFSSLSFNVHGKNMTDPDTEFDRQLQVSCNGCYSSVS